MKSTTNKAHFAIITALFAVAIALFVSTPAHAQQAATAPTTYLVQFSPNASEAERVAWMADTGAILVDWMPQIGVAKLQLDPNRMAASAIDMNAVSFIESDVVVTGEHVVTDPAFLDSQNGYGMRLTNVITAWNVTAGSPDIIVAVVDTGINAAHPEFAGRLVAGYDFINQDNDPADDHGHGTHVAGIIGAALDGVGTVGMCPQCRIMPVKVLNDKNAGMWSTVAKGILFAVDNGARVINLSLGAAVSSATIENAIEYAHSKNVVVVAAAGNSNSNLPFYPAAIPYVLAVSATNSQDGRWQLSNYGAHIDVAAPGSMIYSSYNNLTTNNGYALMSGTSMAAPFVSGLAALVLSLQPQLTGDEVNALITNNATDLGDAGKDDYFGYGRIDAYKTLVAANGNVEPAPDTQASPIENPVEQPVEQPVDNTVPAPVTSPVTSPVDNPTQAANNLFLAILAVGQ